ncbi:MAG: Crp/Fnr family transcriptional regulator [Actinomycetota bacterium]
MTSLLGRWREDTPVGMAAWVARCVGFAETSPLKEEYLAALASYLAVREFERGSPIFRQGERSSGVWIVRSGMIELYAGTGRQKVVVQLLHPGSVDGDIQLILEMPVPYSARAAEPCRCLYLDRDAFERLLRDHPAVSRRWLSSVAARVSRGQERLLGILGKSLPQQIALLLLDEDSGGRVPLPQRTLASMLGVQRPSLNKVLKDLERRGLITLGYAEVGIRDRPGLEKVAARSR